VWQPAPVTPGDLPPNAAFLVLPLLVNTISLELAMRCAVVVLAAVLLAGEAAAAPTAVATFESLGLYWAPSGRAASNTASVRYRVVGSSSWRTAMPLWYDARNGGEYRGSIVHLASGTTYEVEISLSGGLTESVTKSTWSENFPIAQTVTLPTSSSQPLTIASSGSPSGYILYTAAPGRTATIDANSGHDNNVVINNASYVIIRGLSLERARIHAIRFLGNVHDVVIEENDISGWGRVESDGWGTNYDGAIYSHDSTATVERIVVQRNRMHHPRGDSNNWSENNSGNFHPQGPQGIVFFDSRGNHVFRYNSMYSDPDHRFNDCFGAGSNMAANETGFPGVDSDIYGNLLSYCWDDAIESEGMNRNVRIWGNYIDHTFVNLAVASTTVGPVYVFRNVTNVSLQDDSSSTDSVARGGFLKTKDVNGGGIVYFFHNTALQPRPPAGQTYTLGVGSIGHGGPSMNLMTRNNIIHVAKTWHSAIDSDCTGGQCSYDYDLYNGTIPSGSEPHGRSGVPIYAGTNGAGQFALSPTSLGYDQGVFIANFSDGFTGAVPDIGAFEAGSAPMQFGVDAYRNAQPEPEPEPITGALSIDAGGDGHGSFVADRAYVGGTPYTNWTGAIDRSGAPGAAPEEVYQSERYGNVSYTWTGLTALADYDVRLHFAENYHDAAGERRFDVAINGAQVLDDFDVFAAAGGQHRAVVRDFSAAADADGRVAIAFTTVADQALINGLEAFPGCGAPTMRCAGVCTDVMTDEGNCGSCGQSCSDMEQCVDGDCEAESTPEPLPDPTPDPNADPMPDPGQVAESPASCDCSSTRGGLDALLLGSLLVMLRRGPRQRAR
jgi:hypothetical protein